MAIFGEADKDLPFLTQVFQVDDDSPEELEKLLWRLFPVYKGAWPHSALEDFRVLCDFARKLMIDLYSNQDSLDPDISEDIGRTYARLVKGTKETTVHFDLEPKPSGRIPLAQLALYVTESRNRFEMKFAEALERLVFGFYQKSLRLLKCEECRSVFIVQRRGQRFCSHRCRARRGARDRRAERKIAA